MVPNSQGYYEYLPSGYNSGSQTYPVLIFLHGMGELGNGNSDLPSVLRNGPPKLISQGKFPSSFTVNGQSQSFIVISPQFIDWPSPTDVSGVIDYVVSHYRVNTQKIYLTGLSMGGGAVWEYAGDNNTYASRIAAIVPVAGASWPEPYRANIIAQAKLPVWATHNDQDPTVPTFYTNDYVTLINQDGGNPPARKSIFVSTSHDAWTKTYDPNYRESINGVSMNVYEWMLQYSRGGSNPPPPPVNQPPVANAGSSQTITLPTNSITLNGSASDPDGSIASYVWSKLSGGTATIGSATTASTSVSGLVQGTYQFRLTVTDNKGATASSDVSVTVNAVPSGGGTSSSGTVNVNIYGGSNPYSNSAWNNWNVGSGYTTNLSSTAFKYADGTSSSITATLSSTEAVTDNGTSYGSGVAPAEVLRYTSYATGQRTLTISGLSSAKTYALEFYASRGNNPNNNTIFTINGVNSTVSTYNNLTGKASFSSIAPNGQGQIVVTIKQSADFNYLNGFMITDGSTSVLPPPPPPPTSTTGTINVNIFGGSNAYSNTSWNNWNVGSGYATTVNSGAFKYADGSASAVSASLSSTEAVVDNSSSYGAGMAPAEVLRFTSYATGKRSLTISGLSTSKSYYLEFYASRSNNPGNNTIFSVGTTNASVSTYNNLVNKAAFSSITPNAQGQIVVNISQSIDFNYFNGFMITDQANAPAAKAMAVQGAEINTEAQTEPQHTSQIFPNPVTDRFVLQVDNAYTGPLNIQVIDMNGAVKKQFNVSKNQVGSTQLYLSAGDLSAGEYILKLQMLKWNDSVKMAKQ